MRDAKSSLKAMPDLKAASTLKEKKHVEERKTPDFGLAGDGKRLTPEEKKGGLSTRMAGAKPLPDFTAPSKKERRMPSPGRMLAGEAQVGRPKGALGGKARLEARPMPDFNAVKKEKKGYEEKEKLPDFGVSKAALLSPGKASLGGSKTQSPLQRARAEAMAREESFLKRASNTEASSSSPLNSRPLPDFGSPSRASQERSVDSSPSHRKDLPNFDAPVANIYQRQANKSLNSGNERKEVLKKQGELQRRAEEEKEAMREERAARRALSKKMEENLLMAQGRDALGKSASGLGRPKVGSGTGLYERAMRV